MKFSSIGSAASDAVILTVRSDLPYKTFDDMRKAKEIVIGTTGPGSSTHDFPSILKEFTALNLKLVPGYSSRADVMKILRDAFANASKNKELLAEAKKSKMTIDFAPAEEALKVVREVLSQPPEMAQEIGKYIKFGD